MEAAAAAEDAPPVAAAGPAVALVVAAAVVVAPAEVVAAAAPAAVAAVVAVVAVERPAAESDGQYSAAVAAAHRSHGHLARLGHSARLSQDRLAHPRPNQARPDRPASDVPHGALRVPKCPAAL